MTCSPYRAAGTIHFTSFTPLAIWLQMGDSVQSLAHEVASAAANRASNLLQEIEAADANNSQSPGTSNQVATYSA